MLFMVCGPQVCALVNTFIYCERLKCPTFHKEQMTNQFFWLWLNQMKHFFGRSNILELHQINHLR